jgi:hypothetical protein
MIPAQPVAELAVHLDDSSVFGVGKDYRLDDRGNKLYLFHIVQTVSVEPPVPDGIVTAGDERAEA